MNPQDWKRNEAPKSFYNPLKDDFVISYRDEANEPVKYTIPPQKISTYPTYLADYFIKHIVDAIINERELGFLTPDDRQKIEQEVNI